jgi:NAD(P)-dependent dehydrogenase (short-subunit alcohol dehydrogenase family)
LNKHITGDNSGIGFATAKKFVNEEAYAFITGRRERESETAVKEVGKNVTGVQRDVSNLSDLDRLFAQIKREKGKLAVRPQMKISRPPSRRIPTEIAGNSG